MERRNNNFNIVRFMAAFLVIFGHFGAIYGIGSPRFGGFYLHIMGVQILFLIGGYLIAGSWRHDPHPGRYALRRFFRLWPPYAVMILMMSFVAGPLISTVGADVYFQSWFPMYLKNLRFEIVYALPGMFEGNPWGNVVNGSIWTMPVEVLMYILAPVLLVLLRRKKGDWKSFWMAIAFTVSCCAFDFWLLKWREGTTVIFYQMELINSFHLMVFFVIGMLFSWPQMRKILNLPIAVLLLIASSLAQYASSAVQQLVSWIAMPYFVFSLALEPTAIFSRFGRKHDLSFGIYLYGFFFSQWVVQYNMQHSLQMDFYLCFLISFVLTWIAALLSEVLVEKPCMKLCRFLTGRWKERSTGRRINEPG